MSATSSSWAKSWRWRVARPITLRCPPKSSVNCSTTFAVVRGRVFTSDLGVRVLETGLATYPDVSVVFGRSLRDSEKTTSITNPRVVVEVTSDATEDYDRGQKVEHYQHIPSLEAIVVVSHREPRIELWSRAPGSEQ